MPTKRRNHGRNKKGRGNVVRVRCQVTGKAVPKDKAVCRMSIKNMVDKACERDVKDHSVFTNTYMIPKLYVKNYYCIEAAVHQRIVKVRSRKDRRIRVYKRKVYKK